MQLCGRVFVALLICATFICESLGAQIKIPDILVHPTYEVAVAGDEFVLPPASSELHLVAYLSDVEIEFSHSTHGSLGSDGRNDRDQRREMRESRVYR